MFNELVRFEDKIYLSNNLKVFAIEEGRLGLKIDLEKSFDIKNTFIRKIAVFGKLLAVVLDSKLLLTIDLVTCEKTYETMTFKRAMFLYFSENNSIYLGDRAGDIYEIHLSADKPMRLLVGSVSISTDMVFCSDRKYLITADRDEKIRVNYFPNTYDIKHFCLGHKEYVSNVILLSNTDCFLSAGGDQHIFMWSYTTGELLEKISLVENVDLGILKPDVASMEIFKNKLLLVQLQKFKSILLFDVKGKIVTFKKAVEMIAEPLKACFDLNGNIWCTTDSEVQPLEVILAGKDYVLATNASKELAGVKIDSNLISKDPTDFYEIGKLRKWSQWEPNSKPATVAEKRKVLEESGKAKKSKRSGKKRKDNRETLQ